VLVVVALVLVLGAVLARTGAASTIGAEAETQAPSQSPSLALSSSWFCAGATSSPGSVAPGELLFDNAGPRVVDGTVRLVSEYGYDTTLSASVPAGGTSVVSEELTRLPARAGHRWVGAIVTLDGGTASVSEVVTTKRGVSSQPCASAAAPRWYFVDGATLRNAAEEISLLNPYPADAIADLSFTTDQGREQPQAFEGVVVPAQGLTVLNLGHHLRRRQHIAVTVTTRSGEIVAFETEVVTQPPAGAPPVGTTGAINPVMPVAGTTLTLGSTQASTSWWWPEGGEGPGFSESYGVYNPGPLTARLSLDLISGGTASDLGSSSQLILGPYGSTMVTTNGQSWALPGVTYATHLESTNGVPVIAERSVAAVPPSLDRGLGGLLGQSEPAGTWLLPSDPSRLDQVPLGQTWVEVMDPGGRPAVVSVKALSRGRLAPVAGVPQLQVGAGQRAGLQLPGAVARQALAVTSSEPILLEEDSYSPLTTVGMNLSPAVLLSRP
jgi:hypothetical protein